MEYRKYYVLIRNCYEKGSLVERTVLKTADSAKGTMEGVKAYDRHLSKEPDKFFGTKETVEKLCVHWGRDSLEVSDRKGKQVVLKIASVKMLLL